MKQIIQSYKTGEVALREVPVPVCGSKRILVRNTHSLISLGTERSTIELGRKSILGKAAARPDLVRRAWDKAKKEGLLKTWQEAMGRLDTPTPLGYSSGGIIEQCGTAATEFAPGDRVACVGQGFASHAEFISVPVNLACRIPSNVTNDAAAFGMLGIIALHGVRSANLTFGTKVVVLGLGLLGLLTIQILRAYGCEVICLDPSADKVAIARQFGFQNASTDVAELGRITDVATNGLGADAVIITAASKDRTPVDQAIDLCRTKGRIVIVGTTDIHPDRNELWLKEIELVVSRAAGPGSLDPIYELEGVDLPIGDVRWTQKRNLQEFLRLLSIQSVDVQPLITHRVAISEAQQVYAQFMSGTLVQPIGVLLEYPANANTARHFALPSVQLNPNTHPLGLRNLQVGVIGAGLFGKALLLPALEKLPNITLHTLVTSSGVSAEHTARKFGFRHQSTDTESVWQSTEIDAVIGLTPHSQHARLVQSAIEHNKALFLEKPLCVTEKELTDLHALASNRKTLPILTIGHNRRFSPHTIRMQEWLAGRQGPCVIHMRVNTGFIPRSHWVHSEDEGRSRIVGEMSHFIDLIQSLTSAEMIRVSAERISADDHSAVNNDNVVVNFKLSDGSVGSLLYTASGDKAYSREAIEIFFDGKTITSKDFRISEIYQNGKTQSFKTRNQEMGYVEELKHFSDCVRGKAEVTVTATEIFRTMAVIFAIERALATAQIITLSAS
jgi:predicted dehydrogenase